LIPGSKFEKFWTIPEWCFSSSSFLAGVLRGLFDTDGYFGSSYGRAEIMLGRFSSRSGLFVESVRSALISLSFKPKISVCNDGRFKIRLHNHSQICKFFSIIGSSNVANITRFLLWRLVKKSSKIEKVGLLELVNETNFFIGYDIEKISLPFLWGTEENPFAFYAAADELYATIDFRIIDYAAVTKHLLNKFCTNDMALMLGVTPTTIQNWGLGSAKPNCAKIFPLLELYVNTLSQEGE
jgi:hypothetical protein